MNKIADFLTSADFFLQLAVLTKFLQIIKNKYEQVIVFEDDVRFEPSFTSSLNKVTESIKKVNLDWDLL